MLSLVWFVFPISISLVTRLYIHISNAIPDAESLRHHDYNLSLAREPQPKDREAPCSEIVPTKVGAKGMQNFIFRSGLRLK